MGFPQETDAHACWDFLYLGPRSFYCRVSLLVFWCFLRTWLLKGPWKAWSSNSDPSCSWTSWTTIFFVDHPCPTILPTALFGTCIVRTWDLPLELAHDDFATTFSGAPSTGPIWPPWGLSKWGIHHMAPWGVPAETRKNPSFPGAIIGWLKYIYRYVYLS